VNDSGADPTTSCGGDGLVTTIEDPCIDDGGGTAINDSLEIYCQDHVARFCLSNEACPWRGGGRSAPDVTCSTAGLSSDYLANAIGACGIYQGHDTYCCSAQGTISFSGCAPQASTNDHTTSDGAVQ
jgi:hypothetical protein